MKMNIQMEKWPKQGALLFVGEKSTQDIPLQYAKTLLCVTKKDHDLFNAEVHPDIMLIQPESGRNIKVDQIRAFNEWSHEKPSLSSCKIMLLKPAEALNVQAANALLKTLEEPSLSTLIILIANNEKRLLPTLRSRCYLVRSHASMIEDPEMLAFKHRINQDLQKLAKGDIGPIPLAELWNKQETDKILYWLIVHLNEKLKQGVNNEEFISKSWWEYFDEVMEAKKMLEDHIPLNTLLLIETLLIGYERMITKKEANII